jgi:hypothetical protein
MQSMVSDYENLELLVERLYKTSEEIRKVFNEI